jgi:hypothetical protein
VTRRFNWIIACLLFNEQSLSLAYGDTIGKFVQRDEAIEWSLYPAILTTDISRLDTFPV